MGAIYVTYRTEYDDTFNLQIGLGTKVFKRRVESGMRESFWRSSAMLRHSVCNDNTHPEASLSGKYTIHILEHLRYYADCQFEQTSKTANCRHLFKLCFNRVKR